MKPPGLLEASLYCSDLSAARQFYGDVLGLELISEQPGRHVFFRCGSAVLLLFNPTSTLTPGMSVGGVALPLHGAIGPGHVAFRASEVEIDAWRARLEEAGVVIDGEVTWPGGGRSIYFRDPADNVLEFGTPSLWGMADAPDRG
jgi:catechol 2,3-dioxygenase-like lactoylglutathione lyase family enzyme